MYSIKISTHIFPSPIICIAAPSLEDCSKIAKQSYQLNIDYDDNCLAVTQLINGNVVVAINLEQYYNDNSIIVHESLHAAIETLNYVRQPISNHTDELLCYLQQYIYKEIKKFLDTTYDKS